VLAVDVLEPHSHLIWVVLRAGDPKCHTLPWTERYEKRAGEGVETVFPALADRTGPEDLERLAPLLA